MAYELEYFKGGVIENMDKIKNIINVQVNKLGDKPDELEDLKTKLNKLVKEIPPYIIENTDVINCLN